MPILSLIVDRKSLIVKVVRVTCFVSLVTILSGCSAVGFSKPAALQVISKPEASVFLDGKHLGKTPFYSDQLKEGEYTLKVTAESADYIDKITLRGGILTAVNRELNSNLLAQAGETLSLVPGQKGLFIVSLPPDADIAVDGSLMGKTPQNITDLKEGDHKILLSKDGFLDREFSISTSRKYQLLADVTLASIIAKDNGASKKESRQQEEDMVLILNTPQGFLRVRSEPSLSASEVGRVTSGETYEILKEEDEWFQISFAGKIGWISASFAEKIE